MKINLAENMLRFGAKNLTESSKQKLEQLAEQTINVTDKVEFLVGITAPQRVTKPTLFLDNRDPSNPILYFLGTGNDSRAVAIAQNGMIYDGRTLPYYSYNMADFIFKATEEFFGSWTNEINIVETLTAMKNVQSDLNVPGGQIIIGMIRRILSNVQYYGSMPTPVFQLEANKDFKGNLVANNTTAWHNAVRKYLGLKAEPNVEYNKNPTLRQQVVNDFYAANPAIAQK